MLLDVRKKSWEAFSKVTSLSHESIGSLFLKHLGWKPHGGWQTMIWPTKAIKNQPWSPRITIKRDVGTWQVWVLLRCWLRSEGHWSGWQCPLGLLSPAGCDVARPSPTEGWARSPEAALGALEILCGAEAWMLGVCMLPGSDQNCADISQCGFGLRAFAQQVSGFCGSRGSLFIAHSTQSLVFILEVNYSCRKSSLRDY